MPAFRPHSTETSDGPWDGPAHKARVKSGQDRSYYGKIYAWYDEDGEAGAKASYRFIHHEVDGEGNPGPANLTACTSGIAVLNGGRGGTTIPAADKRGVWAHLAKHLQEAGKEAPPLADQATGSKIYQTLQDSAWAMLPAKLEEISLLVEKRLAGEISEAGAMPGRSGHRADEPYQVLDGVAVLPVYGTLGKRMNLVMKYSGGTSTELLARDFRRALADPSISAILLDIDSPGGTVDGTKELADLIQASRGQKPVVAYANGLMASAAYWIGSAAEEVVATDTAMVGSIGVAMLHYDYSGYDEKLGVKRTVIAAGKYKRIASDEKPLTPEGRQYLQDQVDDYYRLFLEAVARQRGTDPETVHEKMADGRIFIGKKAVRAKLVDRIGNFDDALALARRKGEEMEKQLTKAQLQADYPELYQEILAEGAATMTLDQQLAENPAIAEQLRAEGREQERARVMEILEADGPRDLTLAAVQSGQDPKEAFKAFWEARDRLKAQALDNLAKAAAPSVGQLAVETVVDTSLPVTEQAKMEWEKDPQLRREFGNLDAYMAFRKAQANGLVKIKG